MTKKMLYERPMQLIGRGHPLRRLTTLFLLVILAFSLTIYSRPTKATETTPKLRNPIGRVCQTLLAPIAKRHLNQGIAWNISPEYETKIASIFEKQNLNAEQAMRELYDTLVAARLAATNPRSRFFMRRLAADALNQKSYYSRTLGKIFRLFLGPHYNPVFNRIAMPLLAGPLGKQNNFQDLLTAFHEIEHALHRNTSPL